MRYFPIFIDLEGKHVVVVGGGEEALRKVRLLLKTTANITVIATAVHPELAANTRLTFIEEAFQPPQLDGAAAVFSADVSQNAAVFLAAAARGIPVNTVDDAKFSTFLVPSIVDRDPVVVAIGTEGAAPVLAQGLRERIDALLPLTLGALAIAARELRVQVSRVVPQGSRRRSFWHSFFFGAIRDSFVSGDKRLYARQVARAMMGSGVVEGRVSIVDSEQSDAELITLKAQRRLMEADVIVHHFDNSKHILEFARRDAVRMETAAFDARGIAQVLAHEAEAGRLVVWLAKAALRNEVAEQLATQGVPIDVIPSVASNSEFRRGVDVVPFVARDNNAGSLLRAAS